MAGARVIVRFLIALAAIGGIAGAVVELTTNNSPSSSSAYGGLPSWLPNNTVPVGRVVSASAAHPKLAIEGDTVIVEVGHTKVWATAVGPNVPEEGQFPVPATTPCEFALTLSKATAAIPITASQFSIVDERGRIHEPKLSLMGSAHSPLASPGKSVTIELRDVLPTGSGTLRWAPSGGRPTVSWDFDVEID